MSKAKNYFAWQARLVKREIGQRVVEVGCGIGNFTGSLLDRELVIAVDIEPACIEQLKGRFPNSHNLRAITSDPERSSFSELAGFQVESCVCLNVLEHIEDDVNALRRMASIVTPKGSIVLLLPAFQALYGPIDRILNHYRRYSPKQVISVAQAAGLNIRKMHYMNAPGFFGWWLNAQVFKRQAQSPAQIEFFDRFIVPVIFRVEELIRPPFGQSLFVVLEKP